MFVQVIQGHVDDAAPLRAAMDQWVRDVSPGAVGWLGTTGGVTEDGRFIALARFDSAEAARRNSERPEQDRWWSETSRLFSKEATFADSEDVTVELAGEPDTAGFVQIMQGRTSDPRRAAELMAQNKEARMALRPDVLGTVYVGQDGGLWTMAIYFTSEGAAREGERKELPPAIAAEMEELNKLSIGQPEFFDLKDPWMQSRAGGA
jgi:hypothetical protein